MDGMHFGMGMSGGDQEGLEMMIPGNKVGLIIGKGGETIKMLQEKAGVKMVMIQDSNIPSAMDKPLRITGEQMKCQRAKDMVLELMAEKDNERGGGFSNGMGFGRGGSGGMDIPVPRHAVGIVIGRGGDMIKKIQNETGVRIQFKPDDGQSQERMCSLMGPPDKVQRANEMIMEIVNNASFGGDGMNRGGFGGRGPPGGRGFSPGGAGGRFDDGFQNSTTFSVPADKCGLVIGKGGETIKGINNESGAYVQLSRNPSSNPNEKIFNIRGNPDEIKRAIQLISEKAGMPYMPDQDTGMHHGYGAPAAPGTQGGHPMAGAPQATPTSAYNQYGQYAQHGQTAQSPAAQNQYQPQGWGGNYSQQYTQQQTQAQPGADQSKADQTGWGGYYAAGYQPQQQQSTAMNPQTGQPDYSQAWAEYYRQQGMQDQANLILQQAQMRSQQPQQGVPPQ